jgi:hypothetical protein
MLWTVKIVRLLETRDGDLFGDGGRSSQVKILWHIWGVGVQTIIETKME